MKQQTRSMLLMFSCLLCSCGGPTKEQKLSDKDSSSTQTQSAVPKDSVQAYQMIYLYGKDSIVIAPTERTSDDWGMSVAQPPPKSGPLLIGGKLGRIGIVIEPHGIPDSAKVQNAFKRRAAKLLQNYERRLLESPKTAAEVWIRFGSSRQITCPDALGNAFIDWLSDEISSIRKEDVYKNDFDVYLILVPNIGPFKWPPAP